MPLLRTPQGDLTRLGSLVRRAGFGRLHYRLYSQPRAWWRRRSLSREPLAIPIFGYTFHAFPPSDHLVSETLARTGSWETELTEIIRRELKPGQCTVDVGAHCGYYVLLAASVAGNGPILAFEPSSVNRRYLERNIRENGLVHARVVSAALGRERAELVLSPDKACLDHASLDAAAEERVHVYRFDDLSAELLGGPLPKVDLVLIDVEGAEFEVLRGMEETLRRDRPIILVEIHGPMLGEFGTTKAAVLGWIRTLGYDVRWVSGDPLDEPGYTNTYCIPAQGNCP